MGLYPIWLEFCGAQRQAWTHPGHHTRQPPALCNQQAPPASTLSPGSPTSAAAAPMSAKRARTATGAASAGHTACAAGAGNAIASVVCELYKVPLAEVLVDAKHGDHSHFELVTVTVTNEQGEQGVGYTYTGGKGGLSIKAMVEADLTTVLLGQDAGRIERLYDAMTWHVHYVARGGIASFAVSAVDIALWDLRGKRAGEPLWRLLGGFDNTTKCYVGGIDLGYDEAKLLRGIDANLAKGFNGVKIKLGRPTLEEDIARVAACEKMTNVVSEPRNCVSKTRTFVLKMMDFAECAVASAQSVCYRLMRTTRGAIS